MHIIAAKAICFKNAMTEEFKAYIEQVVKNSKRLAKIFMEENYRIVSGGTDNHLFTIDLRNKNLTGKDAEGALYRAGIIVNKNTIPYDPQPPYVASGIRIGTPSVTTRGMKEKEMDKIAGMIMRILKAIEKGELNENLINDTKKEVYELCEEFPIYEDIEI